MHCAGGEALISQNVLVVLVGPVVLVLLVGLGWSVCAECSGGPVSSGLRSSAPSKKVRHEPARAPLLALAWPPERGSERDYLEVRQALATPRPRPAAKERARLPRSPTDPRHSHAARSGSLAPHPVELRPRQRASR